MRDKVWIIYRVYSSWFGRMKCDRKVEGIVYTEEQAQKFATDLAERMDPMFGIDTQEWEMDVDRPT